MAPPTLGQDTDRVLRDDLRLTAEQVDALRRNAVI
jgi:crotonobetainyl-CoA:carnitine CoA-transferase CaiB-like acyl-CoA transferase